MYHREAPPARPHGAEPPLLSWLAVGGSTDRSDAHCPSHLASRCQQAFGIVSIDPVAAVYQLHDLVEETFQLVEAHLSEVDTSPARERFRAQRRAWEQAPEGLCSLRSSRVPSLPLKRQGWKEAQARLPNRRTRRRTNLSSKSCLPLRELLLTREGSEHMLYCSGTCMLEPFGEEHEQREPDHCDRRR